VEGVPKWWGSLHSFMRGPFRDGNTYRRGSREVAG
jgi:hypothetical protein